MGWYPDPADPSQERYWDGQTWTHNVRPKLDQPQFNAGSARRFEPGHQNYAQTPPYGGQHQRPTQSTQQGPTQSSGWEQPNQDVHQGAQPSSAQPQQNISPTYQPGSYVPQYRPDVPVVPSKSTADGVELGGFWIRVVGYVLDGIVLYFMSWIVSLPFADRINAGLQLYFQDLFRAIDTQGPIPSIFDYDLVVPMLWGNLLGVVVSVVYFTLMYRFRGQSLGQMALGLRLVPVGEGTRQGPLTWGKAIARAATRQVFALIPLLGLLDPLWAAWDSKGQTLHDKAAGTQVVKK